MGPTVITAVVVPILVWTVTPASPLDLVIVTLIAVALAFAAAVRFAPKKTIHYHRASIQLAGVQLTGAVDAPGGSAMFQATRDSKINLAGAEIDPEIGKLFSKGFGLADDRSVIHAPGLKVIKQGDGSFHVGVPPGRDVWLQDAVLFALYGRWFGETERAFPNPGDMERGSRVAQHMRELAGNGQFLIWGRQSSGHLHILIPMGFWIDQQVDLLRLLGDGAKNVSTEPAAVGASNDVEYTELMVNRAQVEALWPPTVDVQA